MSNQENTYTMMINFSKVDIGDEKIKELEKKISALLQGDDVEGIDLPDIADSTTINAGVVSHTHEWK